MPQDATQTRKQLEEILRERLSTPQGGNRGEHPDDVITPEGIRVPLPPMWRKPTTIVGTPLARETEKLYKLAPELRGRASKITPGYTSATIEMISDSSDKNSLLAKELLSRVVPLNIGGLATASNKEVYVNVEDIKNKLGRNNMGVLAHELQHITDFAGRKNIAPLERRALEQSAGKTEGMARDYFYPFTPEEKKAEEDFVKWIQELEAMQKKRKDEGR